MSKMISKNEWIALFQEVGLSEDQMQQWHTLFEQRHPNGHQVFLEGLGISPTEIKEMRQRFA